MQLLVIVNTVEVETTEDVLEADQEEDGGGGGVDRAGDSRVHRPDPGEGSHDTQLERLLGLGDDCFRSNFSPWWRGRA